MIYNFLVWLRTGSNPEDINRFRIILEKYLHGANIWSKSGEDNLPVLSMGEHCPQNLQNIIIKGNLIFFNCKILI